MKKEQHNKQDSIKPYLSSAAYGLLFLSMASLLTMPREKRFIPIITGISSIVLGYLSGRIKKQGVLALLTYATLLGYGLHAKHRLLKVIATLLATGLNIAFSLHKVPGFCNQQIISEEIVSEDALPYNLYLNFDKVAAGIITLLMYGTHGSYYQPKSLASKITSTSITALATILPTLIAALRMKFIKLDMSQKRHFKKWAVINLLFVSAPEEATFRTLIQGNLEKIFDKRIALMFSALIFGLAHYQGGKKYVALATLAGSGYGYAYQNTGVIQSSILSHFALNLLHFLAFTYPALDEKKTEQDFSCNKSHT